MNTTLDLGLALFRALPHFDVSPDLLSETCLIHGCEGSTYVAVITVDGEMCHVWWCVCCSSQYTTRYVPIACPDTVPWCVNHQVHARLHQAASSYFDTDDASVLVDARIGVTAPGADPMVWLGGACWSDWEDLGAGVGMTPERARQLGRRLAELADQVEGSRS